MPQNVDRLLLLNVVYILISIYISSYTQKNIYFKRLKVNCFGRQETEVEQSYVQCLIYEPVALRLKTGGFPFHCQG